MSTNKKRIEKIEAAIDGGLTRVVIDGQIWIRDDAVVSVEKLLEWSVDTQRTRSEATGDWSIAQHPEWSLACQVVADAKSARETLVGPSPTHPLSFEASVISVIKSMRSSEQEAEATAHNLQRNLGWDKAKLINAAFSVLLHERSQTGERP